MKILPVVISVVGDIAVVGDKVGPSVVLRGPSRGIQCTILNLKSIVNYFSLFQCK